MTLELCDVADEVLLREYKLSIKRLAGLGASLPQGWRDIRVMYHDYVGHELARRRLLNPEAERRPRRD